MALYQGTAGRFGMLKQASGLGTAETTDTDFHYIAFTGCDFAPAQGVAQLPPEAGNLQALPRGTYKTGVVAAGGVDFIPRLDNRFGYWLEAALGDASTSTDQTIAQYIAGTGTTAGVNAHCFGFVPSDHFSLPYLTTHKYFPNDTAEDVMGEIIQDVRVQQLVLNAVSADIVRARIDMMGRAAGTTVWDLEPGWTSPTLDNDARFAVTSCAGSVTLQFTSGVPATLTASNVLNARLTIVNNLLPPNRSRVIGSPHPVDYPCLSRTIVFETVLLVEDYDMYIQTMGGVANPVVDAGWSCSIASGNFDVSFLSDEIITGSSYYTMRYRTTEGNVDWSARPIVLIPNEPVVLALQGVVTSVSTSDLPFQLFLQNSHSDYS
jgi:hypothetical protein